METRIGNLSVPSREYFNELVSVGLLRPWDASPEAREKHDQEVAEIRKLPLSERVEAFRRYYETRGKV